MAGGKDPPGTRARGRPYAPGYGIPSDPAGMLSWDRVEGHLTEARNYWVATVRPDGRPHVTPVWGLWVGEAFYFGAEPGSRKARNLVENPNVVVHLESGDDVVIVEGGWRSSSVPIRVSLSGSSLPRSPSTEFPLTKSKAPTPCARAWRSPGRTAAHEHSRDGCSITRTDAPSYP